MKYHTFSEILAHRRSVRDFTAEPIPVDKLERLIQVAQRPTGGGPCRAAPSAHSLYPLRLYLTAGRVSGLEVGMYAVDPVSAALALTSSKDLRPLLRSAAFDDQPWIEDAAAIISMYADMETANTHFFSQPPVGRRGERYVLIEAGAVAQNILLQATEMNIATVLVAGFDDDETARVQDLDCMPLMHICMGMAAAGG